MSALPQHRQTLQLLRDQGFLPKSRCGVAFLQWLAPLISGGVVSWQRFGAGRRLVVARADVLAKFFEQNFPHYPAEPPSASPRVAGVALYRDSKSLNVPGIQTVTIRGWQNGVLKRGGEVVDIVTATQRHGTFSFTLGAGADYTLDGEIGLIENPAFFDAFESTAVVLPMIVGVHGRISERFLDWLAAQTATKFRVIHFGDYDPVGLDEFRRLTTRLPGRASLYLPSGLEDLFRRYSKRDLLGGRRSQQLLARLRTFANPEVASVVKLIDRYNAGLEQEALLIRLGEGRVLARS